LFQQTVDIPDNIEALLKLESDYFSSVLSISEKVVKQVQSLPINVLTEMVDYRKEWIGKIQKLEDHRKKLDFDIKSESSEKYIKEISVMASKLVKIDDKIYKNLEKRKLEYVEQSAAIAGQSTYSKNESRSISSTKLNIIQE